MGGQRIERFYAEGLRAEERKAGSFRRAGTPVAEIDVVLGGQTVIVGNYWGYLMRVDLASGKVTRARISQNGISSVCRGGEHVMASSYDGRIYLVEPSGLELAGSLTAMTQRVTGETILQRM